MYDFSELKQISLNEIWKHEASDFTPWLAENIQKLGDALNLDLELTDIEASVGDFSLDLLAEELGSSRTVIIENQFKQTNHDHLGKLLTYAAGYDASIIVWISETIRDEHRQALEWLNQRTDTGTQFFGVVMEVLKIDDSKPALNFKLVVFPNEWQKSKRQNPSSATSPKKEKYRSYFQKLVDELKNEYGVTGGRTVRPSNSHTFSSGFPGIRYKVEFSRQDKARTYIRIYQGGCEKRIPLFDALENQKEEITKKFGSDLEWQRNADKQETFISVYTDGKVESSEDELSNIRRWHIENLLKLKEVFQPEIERALETLNSSEHEDSL